MSLTQAFESTKREALKAFGNDDVYIEKLIENPNTLKFRLLPMNLVITDIFLKENVQFKEDIKK